MAVFLEGAPAAVEVVAGKTAANDVVNVEGMG